MLGRTSPLLNRRQRALSLVELLVALTCSMVLIGGVTLAFISVIRTSDDAEAIVSAHNGARAAVEMIARDLRQLQLDADPNFQQFTLVNQPLAYGDNINNDDDGATDEEQFNGRDDDSDWTLADDRHARIGAFDERALFVGVPDYGDDSVDEDCRFSHDRVTFIVPAGVNGNNSPRQRITYYIGTFDGESNVLLRSRTDDPTNSGSDTATIEPIIFDVVSLDVLAWNANNNNTNSPVTIAPYWEEDWNAEAINSSNAAPLTQASGTIPPFDLPAAFLIRVTVNAERVPLEEVPGWPLGAGTLKTVSMTTIVSVDSVIQDPRYDLYVRN